MSCILRFGFSIQQSASDYSVMTFRILELLTLIYMQFDRKKKQMLINAMSPRIRLDVSRTDEILRVLCNIKFDRQKM